ncbi:MAG: flavin reductase family protein [Actinomycetota bacterium]|nr:flavin reductase family protein [Actinomycetota bacterium]
MERDPQDRSSVQSSLRYLTHGVYVLATRRGRETSGMTAAWVTQVSEKPPCLAISVRGDRYTHDHIMQSATFSLSVLRDDQGDVATHFGETSGEYVDKFLGVPYGLTPSGSPHLLDCLAYLDCRVLDTMRAGDHTVIVGEVIAGERLAEDYPLLYDPSEYEGALS